ncbi:DUF6286 domain-containing protein [Kineococcus sp. SYSU DK005]|uniref:DUF6286 domain-containing protein n=1 Tax=Kineococcus sp. SYSU DK005 TaxID=3383126 RepID=UPI003D7C84D3
MSTPRTTGGTPLSPAKRPTGAGRVGAVGPVLALLLLALALVLGREALVAWGSLGGPAWAPAVLGAVDGLRPGPAVAAGGAAAALLGLWLLATAFARRSRRSVAVRGSAAASTTTRDVARLAGGAARRVDGVLEASASAGRRSVEVAVEATTERVEEPVRTAVSEALRALDPVPRVRVRVRAPSASPTAAPVGTAPATSTPGPLRGSVPEEVGR